MMPLSTYYKVSIMPQWSAVSGFEPTLEKFFDAYRSVLSLVSFQMSSSAMKQQEQIQSQINEKTRKLNEAKSAQSNAYTTEKRNTDPEIWAGKYPKGWPDWTTQNYSYQNQIDNINSEIDAVQGQLDTLIKANASGRTQTCSRNSIRQPGARLAEPNRDGARSSTVTATRSGSPSSLPILMHSMLLSRY